MYVCARCNKAYRWRQGLNRHERYECGQEPRYACPHCPYRSKQHSHLTRHIAGVHKVDQDKTSWPAQESLS